MSRIRAGLVLRETRPGLHARHVRRRRSDVDCSDRSLRPIDQPSPEQHRQRELSPSTAQSARTGLGSGRRRPGRNAPPPLRHAETLARGRQADQSEPRATQFGDISLVATSNLSKGEVKVEIDLPKAPPTKTLLRLRLPGGWKIESVETGDQSLAVDGQTIDITALRGKAVVVARVKK